MPMLKTVILLPKGDVLPDGIMSAYFFLSQANLYRSMVGKNPSFDLKIAALNKTNWIYDGKFGVKAIPIKKFDEEVDLIIVPGFTGDMAKPLKENAKLIEWIRKQREVNGAEVASMCTGAFLLAAAGALDGKKCTTHWAFSKSFKEFFPKVTLETEKIVTDESGVYTSAGAFSSLNLLLYLIEKFADKETAFWLSKVLQVDTNRNSQQPFMILNLLFNHDDSEIKIVQEYIERNYHQEITVGSLANQFAMSQRTLIRRFKTATGITPSEFIQNVRIEAAKRMFELNSGNVNQVVLNCGYKDGASFRKTFKKLTGLTPKEYRSKYQKTT